ncbi:MAG TPA: hypothetical protein VG435_08225, partial [Acidimicrobiales bacterium]|nr:hypothetical protein [Acidimicrobiales bacterium]
MISLLRLPLASEQDVFSARQRAREAARQLGFDGHDEIRVATAVSELGRAAVGQGGVATLTIALVPGRPPQLVIDVEGDNIDLDEGGAYGSAVSASRRLMDSFTVLAGPPTAVRLTKFVSHAPSGFTPGELARVQDMLAGLAESSPFDELRAQNQELVATLDQLRAQQEQLLQLNQELAETNNGVVAMYTQLST